MPMRLTPLLMIASSLPAVEERLSCLQIRTIAMMET